MPETILAFDFGRRRIGVAVGQDITGSASPLGVIDNSEDGADHEAIRRIVNEWSPDRLVVGMPLHADGSMSEMSNAVQSFVDELAAYDLPVETTDERYTSMEAETVLRNARQQGSRGRISKEDVDAAAAVFIAERYLTGR